MKERLLVQLEDRVAIYGIEKKRTERLLVQLEDRVPI